MDKKTENDRLRGITFEKMVTQLQLHYGWEELAKIFNIKCFQDNPSIKSSLKFLGKTPGRERRWNVCIYQQIRTIRLLQIIKNRASR